MPFTSPDIIIEDSKASQDKGELRQVYDRVSLIQPKIIVEIGTWRGYLLKTLKDLFYPDILIGIEKDPQVFDASVIDPVHVIFGDSTDADIKQEVVKALGNQSIDFLFIDGDHTYEGVKKDFEIYAPLVRPGGIIGFHDVALEGKNADGHEWESLGLQVKKFWDEIRQNYRHEEFRGTGLGTGTGILYIDERSKNLTPGLSL